MFNPLFFTLFQGINTDTTNSCTSTGLVWLAWKQFCRKLLRESVDNKLTMSHQCAQWQRRPSASWTALRTSPAHQRRWSFHCEGSQTLVWVAKRDCVVLLLGDIPNITGKGPGWPALADTALRRRGEVDHLQRHLSASNIPQFWKESRR